MEKMEKPTDVFDAVSDDVQEFLIIEYTEFVDVEMTGTADDILEGNKSYRTDEGYHCNKIDENTFEIVELELLRVKRISP